LIYVTVSNLDDPTQASGWDAKAAQTQSMDHGAEDHSE
jgi:hypothetical protein